MLSHLKSSHRKVIEKPVMELRSQGATEFTSLQQGLMHLWLSRDNILPSPTPPHSDRPIPTPPLLSFPSGMMTDISLKIWYCIWSSTLARTELWHLYHKTQLFIRWINKDKSYWGLLPSEERCSLWFSPVPKGKMATEGSEHTSLCLISSSAPRTQPTVPSPPQTSTRKEGILENVWNLRWETKQRGK